MATAANPILPTPGTIPAAPPATLAKLYSDWQTRITAATANGYDPNAVRAVAAADWAKVAAGGAAMTEEEAQVSVLAAHSGTGPVTKGRPTGILGTLKNIVPDAASTLWNFPAGLVNLVHHLPSEATTAAGVLTGNAADRAKIGWDPGGASFGSRLAAGLRNASRTPLVDLLPGLHEAAGLTTGAGRASLQQHPVGSVLDVLPLAGGLTEAGALGSAGDTIKLGQTANEAEKLAAGGNIELANKAAQSIGYRDVAALKDEVPRSARVGAALAEGRPIKALIRAVPRLDEARTALLDQFSAGPLAKGVRRTISMAESRKSQLLEQYGRHTLTPMAKGLSDEEIAHIGQIAPRPPEWPNATPKEQAVLDLLRTNQDIRTADDMAQAHIGAFNVKGQNVIYAGTDLERLSVLKDRLDRRIGASAAAEDALYRAKQNYPDNSPEVKDAAAKANAARARHDQADKAMSTALARTVPATYEPQVQDMIRQKVMAHLQGKVGADTAQFNEAMSAYDRGKPLAAYMPEKTLAKYESEARRNWQALMGADTPIWIPSFSEADLERALHPIRFKDKPPTPGAWKSRGVNRSVGSTNFLLAMGKNMAEVISHHSDEAVANTFLLPLARTTTDIDKELEGTYTALRKSSPTSMSDVEVQNKVRSMAYAPLDDSLGLANTPTMQRIYREQLWIPKDLADAVAKTMAPKRYNELQALNMASIRLFKFTVMGLSPTHQAHIWLGSALPLLASGGFDELKPTRWVDSFHLAKAMTFAHADDLAKLSPGAQSVLKLLNRSLDVTNAEDLMDHQQGLMMGNLARRAAEKAGGVVELSRKLSELGANMYRSIAYLSEEARGLRQGMDPELAAAHGVMYANKTFVDIGGMTPIEQAVAKNLYPFASYTAWALRYLMQYPIDHPIRASVLARLGEHEAAYNQSKGIPNTMAMLFNLGKPNSAGDQWGIQLRAFNPFRNAGTTFTMAGILGGLNPALRTLFTTAGVSTLSGTPDPFPGLDIDPNTGGLVGTTKGASPLAAGEQVIPQLSLLDHYLGLSQQARSLRASDPNAFRRQVFSILNMPFVPQTYTPYLTEAAHARDQLRVAQAAVSSAIKNQDVSSLSIYDNVPVPAKLKPYVGNASFVPYDTFAKTVDAIFAWEKQTGQKVI